MDKNDFDMEFDFEKEYGFDPSLFVSSDDDDFDYDQFVGGDAAAEAQEPAEAAEAEAGYEDYDLEEADASEDLAADFPVRPKPENVAEEPAYEEEPGFETGEPQEDPYEDAEEVPPADEEEAPSARRPRRKKKSGIKMPSLKMPELKRPAKAAAEDEEPAEPREPSAFSKLLAAYLEPLNHRANEDADLDPLDPRVIRRKKREKKRIFKEVYLPAIIAGIALFLIISFFVGAAANMVRQKGIRNEEERQQAANAAVAESQAEAEFNRVMAQVDEMAKGYDYEAAVELLKQFETTTDKYAQEITEKKSILMTAQSALKEIKDTSTIPNLSFHVLIADPGRAFNKEISGDLAGSYNKNFVTTDEFSKILNQLYTGNYVLVDFDSFVKSSTGVDGNESYFGDSLYLPEGKRPVMITETMVNYFEYMVDPDKDGTPDAKGHGFANKLVVDENGDVKAAYVDANGNQMVGNYDLVPILEDFIKEHPDFSYRGARATLAVTGTEGVFGYRTNTSYVATKGQAYYDEQVQQAKEVVQALRDKGYTLASYTYSNAKYKDMSTMQIQAEMQSWTNQVTPVLGDVNVMVFARASDIDAYSGTSFNVLYGSGFRFFLNSGTSPRVDITTTFIKQTRLMVTGEAMQWYSNQFAECFDCNMVLDLGTRGSVPKS